MNDITEIKYTSDVEEIVKLFYTRYIPISNCKSMIKAIDCDIYAYVRYISLSNSTIDGDKTLSIMTGNDEVLTFKVTMFNDRLYARDIVVCYNDDDYIVMLHHITENLKDNCSSNDHSITANMLTYFVTTYGFMHKTKYVQLYPNKELWAVDVTIGNGGDYLVLSTLPKGTPAGKDELEVLYMEFNEDGMLISHSTYLDSKNQIFVITNGTESDEEEKKEETITGIIEGLHKSVVNLGEYLDKLSEMFSPNDTDNTKEE